MINKTVRGFTIVELLVAVVIIGILGTLAIISYAGIIDRTYVSAVKSDLTGNDKKAKAYLAKYGSFPTALDSNNCPSAPVVDKNFCFNKSSATTIISYSGSKSTYTLFMGPSDSNSGQPSYAITPDQSPYVATTTFALRLNKTVDSGNVISKTSDGGFVVPGIVDAYYSATGDPPPCSAGGCQGTGSALVAKFSSTGTLSWAKGWDGSSQEDEMEQVIQSSDGGYVGVGTAHTAGISDNDALLVKYDSSGNKLWDLLIGNTTSDSGFSVVEAQSPDTGYIVSGKLSTSGFVAKFSVSGSLVWYTSLSGISVDTDLANTSDGGYVLAGNNFIMKLSSTGAVSWTKTWTNATNISYTQSIQQTSDGGYLYAGSTSTYASAGNDAYMMKFDSSGNFSWARTWGGAGDDWGYQAIQTNDGGYAVVGKDGNGYAFFAKFDSTANLSWSKEFGVTANKSTAKSIAQLSDGSYAMAGNIYDYDIKGDIFIARYDALGNIVNCNSNLCRGITGTSNSPVITVSIGSVTTGSTAPSIVSAGITLNTLTPTITFMAQ